MPLTPKNLRLTVIAVSVFLGLVEIIVLSLGVPAAVNGRAAFRNFYIVGYMVRTGQAHNLYDDDRNRRLQEELVSHDGVTEAFYSPAYEALLFVPFSLMKYRAAYIAFFATNLALLWLSIHTLRPFLEKLENVWSWLPAIVFLCFFPVSASLTQGQDSIILLTLMLFSAVSFYRGRDLTAGIFLGLTLFKFELALPIALLFLFWRRWRIGAGFLVTGIAVAMISLLLAGVNGLQACTRHLLSWSPPLAVDRPDFGRTGLALPNLHCLFHALDSHISPAILEGATIVCSILLFAWTATRTVNFALAILVALLVSTHGTIYDAVLLVIPIAMVLDARLAVSTGLSRLWSRNIVSTLFIAPSACFLAGSSYCLLSPLMLGLLMPLRFTTADSQQGSAGQTPNLQ
jgi:hypothetical protein